MINFEQAIAARFAHRGGLVGALQEDAQAAILGELGAVLAYRQAQALIEAGHIALGEAQGRIAELQGRQAAARAVYDPLDAAHREARAQAARLADPRTPEDARAYRQAQEAAAAAGHDKNEAAAALDTLKYELIDAEKRAKDVQATIDALQAIPRAKPELFRAIWGHRAKPDDPLDLGGEG